MEILGVDIGGSGIKAAPVEVSSGLLVGDRVHLPTPAESTPAEVGAVVRQLVDEFSWSGLIGCTFPGPVIDGVVRTAVNLDPSWVGVHGSTELAATVGRDVTLVNDADAAGIAEMRLGAGIGRTDTVIVLTFGTGIGSALFFGGALVPNTELGEVRFGVETSETYASSRTRTQLSLSYEDWAVRVSEVLEVYENLLYPGLFVMGGAISADWDQFSDRLTCRTPVVPARFAGNAGIIGAALHAAGGQAVG